MYTENELVRIARRENNNKRKYLVVNRLQGKHIPVVPSLAFSMFDDLAELVKQEYPGERLLLAGFAETATAIGAAVAAQLDCRYIQTTREKIEGVSYLYFSESHSHATEQKLVKDDIDRVMDQTDRIIFIEDEVTTGNTILNLIRILSGQYQKRPAFSVASLLNGMNSEYERSYRDKGIPMHYLLKTDHGQYELEADRYREGGRYHVPVSDRALPCHMEEFSGYMNARRMVDAGEYEKACRKLSKDIQRSFGSEKGSRILVLGTEEFMYPALYTAYQMEKAGCDVTFHATTRSPIEVRKEMEYPLHERFELRSLYDSERVTYVYDLKPYDSVCIITDAEPLDEMGLNSLLSALKESGNHKVNVARWCKN